MTRYRVQSAFILAGCLAACSRSRSAAANVSEWEVGRTPAIVIPDSVNPAGHEFNSISSAKVLRNRDILIANAGSVELVVYDSTGMFKRTVGRKGKGPGEFQGPISVFRWLGDSLVVYDPAVLRWTVMDQGLSARRTAQAPDPNFLQPTWLYRGIMVSDGVTDSVSAWVLTVLDSVRAQDPLYTRLLRAWRDDLGVLWVQAFADKRRWLGYSNAGEPVGTLTMPPGFEPLQIGAQFLLGLLQDSLGVEEVRLYSLKRPRNISPTPLGVFAPVPAERAGMRQFRDLLVAQEMYYSSHGRYADSIDSLAMNSPMTGKFFLLGGDARHWSGVSVHPETGVTCGISVGWPAPLGWLEGMPFCGR